MSGERGVSFDLRASPWKYQELLNNRKNQTKPEVPTVIFEPSDHDSIGNMISYRCASRCDPEPLDVTFNHSANDCDVFDPPSRANCPPMSDEYIRMGNSVYNYRAVDGTSSRKFRAYSRKLSQDEVEAKRQSCGKNNGNGGAGGSNGGRNGGKRRYSSDRNYETEFEDGDCQLGVIVEDAWTIWTNVCRTMSSVVTMATAIKTTVVCYIMRVVMMVVSVFNFFFGNIAKLKKSLLSTEPGSIGFFLLCNALLTLLLSGASTVGDLSLCVYPAHCYTAWAMGDTPTAECACTKAFDFGQLFANRKPPKCPR